mgnify:CR=1 FL=1
MTWIKLKQSYKALCLKVINKESFTEEWKTYSKVARSMESSPPTGLKMIQDILTNIEKNISRDKIKIFDHGCGGGFKSMYFAALGYRNVYGVNVNDDNMYLNDILKKIFKINEKRFIITDGKDVPFQDDKFDFIISSQVVEHLTDNEVVLYYSEEGRVLKKGGLAYHEVPHLFIPYESHSRLWFIHLFPYFLKPLFYGIFKSIQSKKNLFHKGEYYAKRFSGEFLRLRTPGFHKKMLLKYIGKYEDLTVSRMVQKSDFSSYDMDSPLGIRKIIHYIFITPIIGKIFVLILKNMFILQTLSKKN